MNQPRSNESRKSPETLRWFGEIPGHLRLLDQTRLPVEWAEFDCHDEQRVWSAIKQLQVRGAPAIGIAAAYGMVLAAQRLSERGELSPAGLDQAHEYLASSRPTAVNLFWALDRMRECWRDLSREDVLDPTAANELMIDLLATAREIHAQDRQMCHAIGRHGAALMKDVRGVLTHCNAGGLATAEYGTALSVIFTAQDQGHLLHVFVDETRPLLQGARLTAWELQQRQVPATLICDSMAAQVMREGRVQAVITGADRIAANGDSANKIGTYGLAVLAQHHQIPFYIAAPSSTFDLSIADGSAIPIEQRDPTEITAGFGRPTAPAGIGVYNPAFDVTPASLIRGIITEKGVISPVTTAQVAAVLARDE